MTAPAPTLTYEQLIALRPCEDDRKAVERLLGGKREWNGKPITAAQAVAAGVSLDNLVWVASAVAQKDKDVERRLRLWMADCAARVLHLYEAHDPADMRVRYCIVAARQFARGEIDDFAVTAARAAARAAWAAASDAAWAAARAAWAAASDAAWAAAWDAAWDAGVAAARAAWAAASDAAWAAAWDAAWDAGVAAGVAAEQQWQLSRLVAWLSDNEPSEFELPPIQTEKRS